MMAKIAADMGRETVAIRAFVAPRHDRGSRNRRLGGLVFADRTLRRRQSRQFGEGL